MYLQQLQDDKVYFIWSNSLTNPTAGIAQGFSIGAKVGEKLYVDKGGTTSLQLLLCQMVQLNWLQQIHLKKHIKQHTLHANCI